MKKEKQTVSGTRVMRLNRFLGTKYGIICICILEDLLLFFLAQYITNVILRFPEWLRDLDHPELYIGIRQFFPDINLIAEHPVTKWIYLGIVLLMLIVDAVTVYQFKVAYSEEQLNQGQKGVSRWTTNEEIKAQYTEIPDRDLPFPGHGGTIVSRIGKKLYIDDSLTNNLIIGITRSGKGEMLVVPSIDVYSRAEEKTSMVITDPKLELFKMSKATLEERGYDVYLLNLDDPLHSMGFNPLEQITEEYLKKNYAEAELLAQSFSFSIFNPNSPTNTDSFWQDTASSLLTALILAHIEDCVREDEEVNEKRYKLWKQKKEKWEVIGEEEKQHLRERYAAMVGHADLCLDSRIPALPPEDTFVYTKENQKKINMYSIINTFTELARKKNKDHPDLTALDSYFSERPQLNRAKLKYAGIEVAGDRTKGSVFASMMAKLSIFTFENIAKMTAESSLNLSDVGFGSKPVAVFLAIPDFDKSNHFLATVFIRQLTFVLEKMATRNPSGRCDRKVKFLCDEFGNLPAIEGMESIITVCLGRNISFDLYIQAYAQVKKLYGDDAETIMGNCGNQIFILTNDDNTAENFSKNLGTETILTAQRSGSKLDRKKHFTENTEERRLLNMNQLEELMPGECVVKRVMKRVDRKGRRIRPTPIFNSVESGKRFLYRYEYLTDSFPNPDSIDLTAVNTEDRSMIQHRERVWDYNKSFEQILKIQFEMQLGKNVEEKSEALTLKNLINGREICALLKKHLTREEYAQISDLEISIPRLLDLVEKSDMKESEKEQARSLIEMSAL